MIIIMSQVHKIILAIQSDYFMSLFNSNMKECEKSSVSFDYNTDIMEAFVEYMYTGVIDDVFLNNEQEFKEISDYFQVCIIYRIFCFNTVLIYE